MPDLPPWLNIHPTDSVKYLLEGISRGADLARIANQAKEASIRAQQTADEIASKRESEAAHAARQNQLLEEKAHQAAVQFERESKFAEMVKSGVPTKDALIQSGVLAGHPAELAQFMHNSDVVDQRRAHDAARAEFDAAKQAAQMNILQARQNAGTHLGRGSMLVRPDGTIVAQNNTNQLSPRDKAKADVLKAAYIAALKETALPGAEEEKAKTVAERQKEYLDFIDSIGNPQGTPASAPTIPQVTAPNETNQPEFTSLSEDQKPTMMRGIMDLFQSGKTAPISPPAPTPTPTPAVVPTAATPVATNPVTQFWNARNNPPANAPDTQEQPTGEPNVPVIPALFKPAPYGHTAMISPDGKVFGVPDDKVDSAIERGYTIHPSEETYTDPETSQPFNSVDESNLYDNATTPRDANGEFVF